MVVPAYAILVAQPPRLSGGPVDSPFPCRLDVAFLHFLSLSLWLSRSGDSQPADKPRMSSDYYWAPPNEHVVRPSYDLLTLSKHKLLFQPTFILRVTHQLRNHTCILASQAISTNSIKLGLALNGRVRLLPESDARRGTISYIGLVPEIPGIGAWIGVTLDEPTGKNDGTVKGKRYFECDTNCGVFVRPERCEAGDFPALNEFGDEDLEEM